MSKYTNKINKAKKCYENGNLEKALNICENVLKSDYSNEEALSLEGEILLSQGKIDEAIMTWKINSDYNNNVQAKQHLANAEKYTKEGLNNINILSTSQTSVSTNVDSLKEKKFDFSSIGEYKFNPSKKTIKITAISVSSLLVVALIVSVVNTNNYTKTVAKNNADILAEQISEAEQAKEENITIISTDEPVVEEPVAEIALEAIDFPTQDFKDALAYEETTKLYNLLTSIPKDRVATEDLPLYEKAEKYMHEKGVKTIYDIAYGKFTSKDYASSISSFEKALTFANGHYLESHIVYMIGAANENLGNTDLAIANYEMYLEKFANENYAPTCAYHIMMLTKDSDIETAKKYAEKINTDYNSDIYNNANVKAVLNQ